MPTFKRPLVSIDIESTGVDPQKDRIVELGLLLVKENGVDRQAKRFLFNPGMPIPPESTAIHHITDADVANEPSFADKADLILKMISGKDFVGYNLRRFDLVILDEELRRCGKKLDMNGVLVLDAFGIYQKKESRKLEDAVRLYLGRAHEGAHGALPDAIAAMDVLLAQWGHYEDLSPMKLEELAAYSNPQDRKWADLGCRLYYDDANVLRFAFGKHKDKPVSECMGYAAWVIENDFPGSTKDLLNEFFGWTRI